MTAARALTEATRTLAAAGVASPEHDAHALLAHALGRSPAELALVRDVAPATAERFLDLVGQRAARVPLQHLTGIAGFRRLDLAVGPGVFVPRPETEVLVQWALDVLRDVPDPVVVDLCAGSGAIALAVADECPRALVHAVEREPDALAWAARNCAGSAVALHGADVADCLPDRAGVVDLVLSNPPYIPDGAGVEPEVGEHDPAAALWGGPDGLVTVRLVARTAARLLRPGGRLGIEHADLQGDSVPALLRRMGGWEDVADHRDLTGRPRFVTAVRGASLGA